LDYILLGSDILSPGPDVPEQINLGAPPHIEHGKLAKLHTLATGVCLLYLGIIFS
jgi:hypothetical protein